VLQAPARKPKPNMVHVLVFTLFNKIKDCWELLPLLFNGHF